MGVVANGVVVEDTDAIISEKDLVDVRFLFMAFVIEEERSEILATVDHIGTACLELLALLGNVFRVDIGGAMISDIRDEQGSGDSSGGSGRDNGGDKDLYEIHRQTNDEGRSVLHVTLIVCLFDDIELSGSNAGEFSKHGLSEELEP